MSDDRGVLDAGKRERIVALVANGSSRRVAARFLGCSPSTITRTAARDPLFAEQLARAEENVEVGSLGTIRRAAGQEKYWRAAAWLLERRNPDDFGHRPPGTYTADQVLAMFVQALSSLEVPDESRQQAIEKLDTLLLEFDGGKTHEKGNTNFH